jgi:hypothetical protein
MSVGGNGRCNSDSARTPNDIRSGRVGAGSAQSQSLTSHKSGACSMATDTSVSIAANGDVYLLVGPDWKRLRVSSQILRNASTYFSNLFGPNFAEGQNLSSSDPKEVRMPDDNARAVETICNIIHLRNDAVPLRLAPEEVFEIAVAADKFDCVSAVKLASIFWLKTSGTEVQVVSELARLLGAAYILDNGDAFGEITLAMMMQHKESYLPLVEHLLNFVPWEVLCT